MCSAPINILEACVARSLLAVRLLEYPALRRYKNLVSGPSARFAQHQVLNLRLCSTNLDEVEVIPLNGIQSHFARCPVTWMELNAVFIITLNRNIVV